MGTPLDSRVHGRNLVQFVPLIRHPAANRGTKILSYVTPECVALFLHLLKILEIQGINAVLLLHFSDLLNKKNLLDK